MERELTLEPRYGVTLAAQTYREYIEGCLFKVVYSSVAKYRRGELVTSKEIADDERYHAVKYTIHFNVQTVNDYMRQQAAVDHAFAERHGIYVKPE